MSIIASASRANLSSLRRVKLLTSSGLENSLIKELDRLSLSLKTITGGKSYVDLKVTLDDIWTIILRSRICEELYIHICDPFVVNKRQTLIKILNAAEWSSFIPFSVNLPKPYIKVISKESQLYHTGMIENIVHEVIKRHCHKYVQLQGDDLPTIMAKRRFFPLSPKLIVKIENDLCEVLANTSGDLTQRPWYKTSAFEDRLKCTAAAAITQDVISTVILNGKNDFTIWDPFCHNGSLLMEIYSYFAGSLCDYFQEIFNVDLSPRPNDSVYPLTNFPLNSSNSYEAIKSSIKKMPHTVTMNLIGSDECCEYIQCANDILQNLTSTNQLKAKIRFNCLKFDKVGIECSNLIIFSNMYYGNKNLRNKYINEYKEFSKYLISLRRHKHIEVYIIAPNSFKKISCLNWKSILKFNNNGILVELIKLI